MVRSLQLELFNKIKEHNPLILLDPRFREDDELREDDENLGLQQPQLSKPLSSPDNLSSSPGLTGRSLEITRSSSATLCGQIGLGDDQESLVTGGDQENLVINA